MSTLLPILVTWMTRSFLQPSFSIHTPSSLIHTRIRARINVVQLHRRLHSWTSNVRELKTYISNIFNIVAVGWLKPIGWLVDRTNWSFLNPFIDMVDIRVLLSVDILLIHLCIEILRVCLICLVNRQRSVIRLDHRAVPKIIVSHTSGISSTTMTVTYGTLLIPNKNGKSQLEYPIEKKSVLIGRYVAR